MPHNWRKRISFAIQKRFNITNQFEKFNGSRSFTFGKRGKCNQYRIRNGRRVCILWRYRSKKDFQTMLKWKCSRSFGTQHPNCWRWELFEIYTVFQKWSWFVSLFSSPHYFLFTFCFKNSSQSTVLFHQVEPLKKWAFS